MYIVKSVLMPMGKTREYDAHILSPFYTSYDKIRHLGVWIPYYIENMTKLNFDAIIQ